MKEYGSEKDRDDMVSKAMTPSKMKAARLRAMMKSKKGSSKK